MFTKVQGVRHVIDLLAEMVEKQVYDAGQTLLIEQAIDKLVQVLTETTEES